MNADVYETLPTSSVAVHMTAGAFAGIMEHCVMYPIDSVKTRMQSLSSSPGGGVSEVLWRMVKQEGISRPIRGMTAMAAGAGPAHALYFSCYEYLKNKFMSPQLHPERNFWKFLFAYGTAGCMATVVHDGIMNPAEVVKQRLQMYNSPYRGVLKCIQNIYKQEGLYAFYRSYTTQLTMNVPFQSIHFITYEITQALVNPDHTYRPLAHIICGGLAGAVAAAVTTPLDVCKTLLNTQSDIQARGMRDALVKIYTYGGLRGYFRGVKARVMYQMPATAICWVTYESFKYMLLRSKQDDGYCEPEIDDDPTGVNQNASSRSSRIQGVGLYLNKKNTSSPVLLDVTTS